MSARETVRLTCFDEVFQMNLYVRENQIILLLEYYLIGSILRMTAMVREILLQSIFERSLAIINSKFVQGMSYI